MEVKTVSFNLITGLSTVKVFKL